MGKAERTTKLLLDLGDPQAGGANVGKREYLASTTRILNDARAFYLEFFLAHPHKLFERVQLIDKKTGEVREATISADKLLSLSQNIRRSRPVITPIPIPTGTSASAFLICLGNIAVQSSRTASAKPGPTLRPMRAGRSRAKSGASQANPRPRITPPSTLASSLSSLIRSISTKAL